MDHVLAVAKADRLHRRRHQDETSAGAAVDGLLAAHYTARAAVDGYTFLIHHKGMATAPALYRK